MSQESDAKERHSSMFQALVIWGEREGNARAKVPQLFLPNFVTVLQKNCLQVDRDAGRPAKTKKDNRVEGVLGIFSMNTEERKQENRQG